MSADRAHTTSLHRARGPEDYGTAGHGYTISFMGANYVARQVGYRMTGGWGQGDRAASAHFAPLETFRARFAEIAADVRALGFEAMDVWTSHLAAAREVLDEHGLSVPSLGGWFGSTAEEFEATCRIAEALGGDSASLHLASWQEPNSAVELAPFGEPYRPLGDFSEAKMRWGRGVHDLARAILEGRPHLATGEQAAHVVEILCAVSESVASGRGVAVRSSFTPPEPFAEGVAA